MRAAGPGFRVLGCAAAGSARCVAMLRHVRSRLPWRREGAGGRTRGAFSRCLADCRRAAAPGLLCSKGKQKGS